MKYKVAILCYKVSIIYNVNKCVSNKKGAFHN